MIIRTLSSRVIALSVFCLSVSNSAMAALPTGYAITDLGNLGGGFSTVADINEFGQIAGSSMAPDQLFYSFITSKYGAGVMKKVTDQSSLAYGINAFGQVVGQNNVTFQAFFTGANGGAPIRPIGPNGVPSVANAINRAGRIVGYIGAYPHSRAFVTGSNGRGVTYLGLPGEMWSVATGINDAGQVVGYSNSTKNINRAFLASPNGSIIDLGTLGGKASLAAQVNRWGQVVGLAVTTGETNFHAFITGRNGQGMRDLLPTSANSEARGINTNGQVVGYFYLPDGYTTHAFVTDNNGAGLVDLNSLITMPDGVHLIQATGINDFGRIIAIDNNGHAYLLTPYM